MTPPNLAEIPTDRIRQNFQAGNLIFAMNWGYVWNRTQNDADIEVKGKVGVVPLPGFTADKAATCIGGWQLAVVGLLEEQGRGREARALPLEPGGLEAGRRSRPRTCRCSRRSTPIPRC